jgi:hypothetical protein
VIGIEKAPLDDDTHLPSQLPEPATPPFTTQRSALAGVLGTPILTRLGWAHSGHSSGTVGGLEDIRTTQKCPSRVARPG